jgi:pyruvate/2-oxoacid:ferredoxin oxidoreductase alpha subunit
MALARKTLKLATKYGLPVLASSDSHRVSHALQSYTQFEDLDFSSPEELKASIREQLKKHKPHLAGRSNGVIESYRHGLRVLETHLLLRTGLIKRT